jgi:mono/diheme cytochrome c family protein
MKVFPTTLPESRSCPMPPSARRAVGAALLLAFLGPAFVPGLGSIPARQVPQDDEEAAYREAVARRSLEENCLICHTEDMIAGQRLTPAQWKAEVEKMVTWGAPLPNEAAGPLVEYLARRYSDREAPPVPARSTLKGVGSLEAMADRGGSAPASGDLARGEQLYAANCATCHGPTALGGDLGPALAGKAILDHPRDYDRIIDQGLRRMPGFRLILKGKDQADVLAWLRHRSYPEPIGPEGR